MIFSSRFRLWRRKRLLTIWAIYLSFLVLSPDFHGCLPIANPSFHAQRWLFGFTFLASQTMAQSNCLPLNKHTPESESLSPKNLPWGQTTFTLFSMTLHNFSNPTEMCFWRKKTVLSNIKRRLGVRSGWEGRRFSSCHKNITLSAIMLCLLFSTPTNLLQRNFP